MKCPTCNVKKTTDKQLGTVWKHEDNCITAKKEFEKALPFEALLKKSS